LEVQVEVISLAGLLEWVLVVVLVVLVKTALSVVGVTVVSV